MMRKGLLVLLYSLLIYPQVALVQWDSKGLYKEIQTSFENNLSWGVDNYNVYGDKTKIPGVMERVKNREYKIVVVIGDELLKAAALYLGDVPIVFMGCNDSKPAQGKKNITGVKLNPTPKEVISTVKQLLPDIKKVGLIFKSPTGYVNVYSKALESAGIKVEKVMANDPGGVNTALRFLTDIDLLWMVPDELNRENATFKFLLMYSQKKKIPILGLDEKYVKAGALFTVVSDVHYIGSKGATYVKNVVNGSLPETLPIVSPKASYILNLKVAKKLKITFPDAIIKRARSVIK